VDPNTAQFFGGTSILIIVGVLLDVMRQVETHLIQQNYDGFLKRGRLKSRYEGDGTSREGQLAEASKLVWIWVILGLLILIAISTSIYRKSLG
jgi:preprotein translocase subunit SecY